MTNPTPVVNAAKDATRLSAQISTFISLALVECLVFHLGSIASIMTGLGEHSGGRPPQFALLSALGACVYNCSEANDIDDQDDLDYVLQLIGESARASLEVVSDEAAAVAKPELDAMLTALAREGRLALKEALAGFPESGGRFSVWKQVRYRQGFPGTDYVVLPSKACALNN
jgi:hypothetical protein